MKIAVGCDHAAVALKKTIVEHIIKKGYEVEDFGCYSSESVDYPDYAVAVSESVANGKNEFGILICGTGIGMSMAANKIKGIRCAHCENTFSAKATRMHNDANVLALGERVTGVGLALEIVDNFLETPFSRDERHIRRIDKISQIEEKYFK